MGEGDGAMRNDAENLSQKRTAGVESRRGVFIGRMWCAVGEIRLLRRYISHACSMQSNLKRRSPRAHRRSTPRDAAHHFALDGHSLSRTKRPRDRCRRQLRRPAQRLRALSGRDRDMKRGRIPFHDLRDMHGTRRRGLAGRQGCIATASILKFPPTAVTLRPRRPSRSRGTRRGRRATPFPSRTAQSRTESRWR